ncbi:hypothetical protein [Corallococcus exercitus]|uniref:hypothetical protein n=1 Tax=Corallococcus exercitus TaxID=2316736 RepID=UPI0035D40589
MHDTKRAYPVLEGEFDGLAAERLEVGPLRWPWLLYGSPVEARYEIEHSMPSRTGPVRRRDRKRARAAPYTKPIKPKQQKKQPKRHEQEQANNIKPNTQLTERYILRASTRQKGTATNNPARQHAKTGQAPVKFTEEMTYTNKNGITKTVRFIGYNPIPQKGDMQAGHIKGKQHGGSGTDLSNIFPQNPIANMHPYPGRAFTDIHSHRHNSKKWITKEENWKRKHPRAVEPRKWHNVPMSWREWEDKKRRKMNQYPSQDIPVVWTGIY